MKKTSLEKEVENLQNFSDIDVTQYPSPEQASLAQALDPVDNIEHYDYYIDGKTIIAKLNNGEYMAIRKNPKSKSLLTLLELLENNSNALIMKVVRKSSNK